MSPKNQKIPKPAVKRPRLKRAMQRNHRDYSSRDDRLVDPCAQTPEGDSGQHRPEPPRNTNGANMAERIVRHARIIMPNRSQETTKEQGADASHTICYGVEDWNPLSGDDV